MNENDSGPAASSGEGFKTIISMSLVAVVDGALCFVNQSQFVRLSVAGGRISSRGSSSGDVVGSTTTPSAPRESQEKETRHADGI